MNLGAFGRLVADLTDALVNRRERLGAREFVAGLKRDVRSAFANGVDPVTGTPWAPLKYRQGQILVLTGALRAAALATVDAAEPSGWGVTVTLAGPAYAGFHQSGTKRTPQRRFFGISPETRERVRKNCTEDIVKLIVAKK